MLTQTAQETSKISYEDFQAIAPDAYKALIALGKSVDDAGLDKKLTELVKIRVSQINSCAFCLQLHLLIARRLKLETVKIDLVATWRDVDCFSERERTALAWAEELTRMNNQATQTLAPQALTRNFSKDEIAFLTVTIATINAWNRIAGSLHFAPQMPKES